MIGGKSNNLVYHFVNLCACAVITYCHDIRSCICFVWSTRIEHLCEWVCVVTTKTIHCNADKFACGIVSFKRYSILHLSVLHLYLSWTIWATSAECRGNFKFKIIAVDVEVVSVDIVNFFREISITLLCYISLEVVNHFFVNDVPTCSVVFNICIDGTEHTSLFKEGKKVNLCTITSKFHPVYLLLTIGIVSRTVIICCADRLNYHRNDVGALSCQCSPKCQLPEGSKFNKVVVVTTCSFNCTYILTTSILTLNGNFIRSSTVIVGTILQLPSYALTQTFFEVCLEATTTHARVIIYTRYFVFKAETMTITWKVELCPSCINIVSCFTTSWPLETRSYLIVVSPFVTNSPEVETFRVRAHNATKTCVITIWTITTCSHKTIIRSKEKLTVLHLLAVTFQTENITFCPLYLLV